LFLFCDTKLLKFSDLSKQICCYFYNNQVVILLAKVELIIILSRVNKLSYHEGMNNIPSYLNKYFQANSFILVYPMQQGVMDNEEIDLNNPSLIEPIEKLDEIGKNILKLFRRK